MLYKAITLANTSPSVFPSFTPSFLLTKDHKYYQRATANEDDKTALPIAALPIPGPVHPSPMPFSVLEPLDRLWTAKPEFRYVERGSMASMGMGKGVVDLGKSGLLGGEGLPVNLTGFLAFCSWRFAYLTKQLSWTNRLLIPMFWFKSAFFGRDISRF